VKHMPGHGRALADSHKELPTVTADEAELEADLAPFRALASAPIAMTGHIRFTAWDAANPATQSSFVIGEIIRKRIGFDGLLLTDDLDMEALAGAVPDRAARALAAGCDIALNCWAKMADMIGIARACPIMTEAATGRLTSALAGTGALTADPERHAGLVAKRDNLLALRDAAA
ncbi:MAG TPA: glycoside hydrolase family 3 N-terminal domain-containing protein, partial [Novosphingobium sp.]